MMLLCFTSETKNKLNCAELKEEKKMGLETEKQMLAWRALHKEKTNCI